MVEWGGYLLLAAAGCAAGTINVIAGGGSFLTLPLLIFLGLPATVANGTNRLGVITQNIGAVWVFHLHGFMDWRCLLWAALPATAGAALGSWAALLVGDQAFKRILAFLMVAVTLWTLWDPMRSRSSPNGSSPKPRFLLLCLCFFVVGIYSGFVQAGVGFLVLAATTVAGLDLVRGNAVKVVSVLASVLLSLFIFAGHGKVHWAMGGALAAGNLLGGLLGVRMTVLKGHGWVKRVVTVTVIVFAVLLWFTE